MTAPTTAAMIDAGDDEGFGPWVVDGRRPGSEGRGDGRFWVGREVCFLALISTGSRDDCGPWSHSHRRLCMTSGLKSFPSTLRQQTQARAHKRNRFLVYHKSHDRRRGNKSHCLEICLQTSRRENQSGSGLL